MINRVLALVYGVAAVLAVTGDESAQGCALFLVGVCFLPSIVAACAAMLRTVAARPGLDRRLCVPDTWRGRCALLSVLVGWLPFLGPVPTAPLLFPALVTVAYADHVPAARRWREVLLSLAPILTIVVFVAVEAGPLFPFNMLVASLLVAAAIQLWPARTRTHTMVLAGL